MEILQIIVPGSRHMEINQINKCSDLVELKVSGNITYSTVLGSSLLPQHTLTIYIYLFLHLISSLKN